MSSSPAPTEGIKIIDEFDIYTNCCCCSASKLCPTLSNPMDGSTPGSSVLLYLPEFAQTHVHWVGDATISSSVPSSSCPQSFPASGSFPESWFFALGGQSTRASAPVLPVNIQGWFPLGLIGLISLLSKGRSLGSININWLNGKQVSRKWTPM